MQPHRIQADEVPVPDGWVRDDRPFLVRLSRQERGYVLSIHTTASDRRGIILAELQKQVQEHGPEAVANARLLDIVGDWPWQWVIHRPDQVPILASGEAPTQTEALSAVEAAAKTLSDL